MKIIKRKQAVEINIINRAKTEYWNKYFDSLGRNTQLEQVWGTIKRMSGNRKEYGYPIMKDDGNVIIDNKNKAELLAQTFINVNSTENLSNKDKRGKEGARASNKEALQREKEYGNTINMMFSVTEPNNALWKSDKITPGKYQINYCMSNNLSNRKRSIIKII